MSRLAQSRQLRPSRRITVEDKVASHDGRVAGKAGVVHHVAGGFAVVELSEPPAAGRGVLSRVLDHELNAVLGCAGHIRLEMAKGIADFLQRVVTPGKPGNDGAARIGKLRFS